jgi:hypothetical protein
MDLLDVALEEGQQEQQVSGEEAEALSQMRATSVEISNEGKSDAEKEPVPKVDKFLGTGMSVPTEKSLRSSNASQNYSLERLKKLLPIIPGK